MQILILSVITIALTLLDGNLCASIQQACGILLQKNVTIYKLWCSSTYFKAMCSYNHVEPSLGNKQFTI